MGLFDPITDPIEDAVDNTVDILTDPWSATEDFIDDPGGFTEDRFADFVNLYPGLPGWQGTWAYENRDNIGDVLDDLADDLFDTDDTTGGGGGGGPKKPSQYDQLLQESLARSRRISQEQMLLGDMQNKIARDQLQHWQDNFRPVETQFAKQALTGLDGGYYADQAGTDARLSFDKAGQTQARDLMRAGIDPTSGRGLNATMDLNVARAMAEAGARNKGREYAVNQTQNMRGQVANMGRQIPTLSLSGANAATGTYGEADTTFQDATMMMKPPSKGGGGRKNDDDDESTFDQILDFGSTILGKVIFKCIAEGQYIDTPTGEAALDDVRAGDTVIGYDGRPAVVAQKFEYHELPAPGRWYEVTFDNGRTIIVCDMHRICGTRAMDLTPGMAAGPALVQSVDVSDREVKRSFDLLTYCRDGSGGYRMAGVPVNSMVIEMMKTQQALGERR